MARLSLTLFGPLRLAAEDGSEFALHADKARALLAYLAVESGRPHRREELAGLLWPGYPERSARQSLSQALFTLHQELHQALDGQGSDPLIVNRSDVQLNCDGCSLDVSDYDALLSACRRHGHPPGAPCDACAGHMGEALALYQGEFLAGFSLRDSPEYEEWLLLQRERYHRLATQAAGALAHQLDGEQALVFARRWVALDPLDEAGHRRVMTLLAGGGHRSLALGHYEACRRILKAELGIEPDEATRALFDRIRKSDPGVVRVPAPVMAADVVKRASLPTPGPQPRPPPRHNLPAAVDSFVGRERELRDVQDMMRDPAVRLVTLVGAGGMGKTRLAVEAARCVLKDLEGGAWLVDLVPLAPGRTGSQASFAESERNTEELAAAVAHAVSSALLVSEADKAAGSAGVLSSLVTAIASQALLVLLDGCEPLLDGVAPVAATLLAHCPNLTILATSREPLRLTGEHLYQVNPLDVPSDPVAALAGGAVRLLAERVAAARYGAHIDEGNVGTAMEICRRLDGMPLAIELAAARLSALTLEDLAIRLDGHELQAGSRAQGQPASERWALLSAGSRAAHPRQRTLMNTLDWSYGLLQQDEQRLFDRLSVFSGSYSLEAVEAICDGEIEGQGNGRATSADVRLTLASLVDCSLVQRVQGPGDRERYRLIESVRAYGQDRLEERGEADRVAQRHAEYYAAVAEAAHPVIWSGAPELVGVLAEMDAEHDNLAAAMRWCLAEGRKETAIRLGSGAHMWAMYHARISQYGEWTRAALALPGEVPHSLRARGLEVVSTYFMRAGRPQEQAALLPELLAAAREAGDPRREAWALWQQALHLRDTGEHGRCVELLRESLSLARAAGDATMVRYDEAFLALYEERGVRLPRLEAQVAQAPFGQQPYLETLCCRLALQDGELTAAERHYRAATAGWDGLSNYAMEGTLKRELASLLAMRGDFSETDALLAEGLKLVLQVGHRAGHAMLLRGTAALAQVRGDWQGAHRALDECLSRAESLGAPWVLPYARLALAEVLAVEGDTVRARELCAQVEAGAPAWDLDLRAAIAETRGWIALLRGGAAESVVHCRLALDLRLEVDWLTYVASAREHLGWALAEAGQVDEAAFVLAKAQSEREGMGMLLYPVDVPHHERAMGLLRRAA